MNRLSNYLDTSNHHFNILTRVNTDEVISTLKERGDIQYNNFNQLLVDDAREIAQQVSRKRNEKVSYIISANLVNIQAQNALLKFFEEVGDMYTFYLILPDLNNILPTVTSRAEIFEGDYINSILPTYAEVSNMSIVERVKLIDVILNDLKNEEINKQDILDFLNLLIKDMKKDTSKSNVVKRINDLSQYVNLNGSSVKSILEYCVLSI